MRLSLAEILSIIEPLVSTTSTYSPAFAPRTENSVSNAIIWTAIETRSLETVVWRFFIVVIWIWCVFCVAARRRGESQHPADNPEMFSDPACLVATVEKQSTNTWIK